MSLHHLGDGRQEASSLGNKLGFYLLFANFSTKSSQHKRQGPGADEEIIWISLIFPASAASEALTTNKIKIKILFDY